MKIMKKKIFNLPVVVSSVLLAGFGYYWGAAIQQAKVVNLIIGRNTADASDGRSVPSASSDKKGAINKPVSIMATTVPAKNAKADKSPAIVRKTKLTPVKKKSGPKNKLFKKQPLAVPAPDKNVTTPSTVSNPAPPTPPAQTVLPAPSPTSAPIPTTGASAPK